MFDSSLACAPGLRFWLPGPIQRSDRPWIPARSLGSRACSFSTCVRLLDYAGPDGDSRCRFRQCGLPVVSTRSAPGLRFSKLDSSPVDASVYTSPGPSRHPAQDLRSRWFATPFLWGSLIPDCTPVYPDDCAPSRSRLGKHVFNFDMNSDHDWCYRAATVRERTLSVRPRDSKRTGETAQCHKVLPDSIARQWEQTTTTGSEAKAGHAEHDLLKPGTDTENRQNAPVFSVCPPSLSRTNP